MITLQHNTGPAVQEQAAWAGAQVFLLGVLSDTVGVGLLGWFVGITYAVATWALLSNAMRRTGTLSLGPADRVTLARAVLVGGVTALVADRAGEGGPTTIILTLAAIALALDFVDGLVARRTGTASSLGARFDMEVDAFLILVLGVHVARAFGPWVLAIGAMRYLFVAASWALRWLRATLPPSFGRKTVAAAQGVILVAASSGLVPGAVFLLGLALAALLWSFGRDIAWLWRNAPVPVPVSLKGCRHV